jgi:hypothetical protein
VRSARFACIFHAPALWLHRPSGSAPEADSPAAARSSYPVNAQRRLAKALVALAPASLLLAGSAIVFFRERHTASFLQLFGAGCLALVVLAHICEALRLFPAMGWGEQQSLGHYLKTLGAP